MPYKTGQWGVQAKERNKHRLTYFLKRVAAKRKGISLGNNHLKIRGESIAREVMKGELTYVDLSSHDFLWNGQKVEVKSSESNKKNGSWYFHISNKNQFSSDYFLCLGLKKGKLIKSFLIPTRDITVKHMINIPSNPKRRCKYEEYIFSRIGVRSR